MANEAEDDLPSGALLSKSQREWLAEGAQDPENSAHRSLRARIRDRLRQSFTDFRFLDNLPREDREAVFRDIAEQERSGMVNALSYIYQATSSDLGAPLDGDFETILERAIRKAEYEQHQTELDNQLSVKVDSEIKVSYNNLSDVELEEIGEKIERKEWNELTEQEYVAFLSTYFDALDPQYPARRMQRYRAWTEEEGDERTQEWEESARGAVEDRIDMETQLRDAETDSDRETPKDSPDEDS